MRVLILLREFFSPSFPFGGAEHQALKLAKELMKINVDARIVTGLWEWGQPRREVIQGVQVHRHFSAWGVFQIKGLRKFGYYAYLISLFWYLLWHRGEYQIIHCQSALVEASVGVLAGHWLNKPTLIRPMANGIFGDFNRLRYERRIWWQERLARNLRRADAVIALNPQISAEMIALGLNAEKLISIPNGVDVEPGAVTRDYTLNTPMRIAFVGRLHPQKDAGTLLRSLGYLAKEAPGLSWRLSLAGTGPSEIELKSIADEIGIGQYVEFLGFIEHPHTLLMESDCFVLPSLSEGMSNALLEAMATGLPCIASDIAGNNNLIRDRHNGILVPPKDELALAKALLELSQDEGLRQRLGQAARRIVEEQYSLHSVAQRYAALYQSLL